MLLPIPDIIFEDWQSVQTAIEQIRFQLSTNADPTFAGLTLTTIVGSDDQLTLYKVCTEAAGLNVLRVTGLQTDDTALTGTLRGAYIDVSNGSIAATGTIRGMELKARTEAPGDTGNDVTVLEGLSISVDSKGHSVTTMRAAEFILDGKTGGTITEAVGLRIANNLQANKATNSYGLQIYRDSFDYTADIQLSSGGLIGGSGGHLNIDSSGNIDLDDGNLTTTGTGTFEIVNVTDEDTGYQIDGTIILRTGALVNVNVLIGENAGLNIDVSGGGTDGTENVYIGKDAGKGGAGGSIGHFNMAIGKSALSAVTSGTSNMAMGTNALLNTTVGSDNIAIGTSALQTNDQSKNVAIGTTAMLLCAASYYNVAIGFNAGRGTTGQSYNSNVMMGYRTGYSLTTGSRNIYIGSEAGRLQTSGSDNIFIGYKAGYRQTTLSDRLIIDNQLRADATTELTNAIFYGVMAAAPADQTLRINAELTLWGDLITDRWLESTTNTLLGVDVVGSGNLTTGGLYNVGIGSLTLEDITSGAGHTAIGYGAGRNITNSNYNTCIGFQSLFATTTGDYNVAVGYQAGAIGNGDNSVFLGKYAGYWETGSNKLFIDNAVRTNEADARVKALIYGVFAAATADQTLTINAVLDVSENIQIDSIQVVGNRVIDARCDDALNSGDATTDGVIDALRDAMITHGLIAAA